MGAAAYERVRRTAVDDVLDLLARFIAAPEHVLHVVALWLAHAHAIDAFWTTPRLIVESPTAECGKTLLLEVMGYTLPHPIRSVSISAAALVRILSTRHATILLDEADKTIGRADAQDNDSGALLYAVANGGYRRGSTYTRCIGNNHDPVELPTFAPLALAGITSRSFDHAFRTRAIPLWLDRGIPREDFEWNEHLALECETVRDALAAWAQRCLDDLRAATPPRPSWMHGRAAEVWGPLLTVASVAGDPWPSRVLVAARALAGYAEDDDLNLALLAAARDVFGDRPALHTVDLLAGLNAIDDARWSTWNDGKGLSAVDFRNRVVKQFRLHGSTDLVIDGSRSLKGYRREWFDDVWRRYCSRAVVDRGSPVPSSDPLPALPALPATAQRIAGNRDPRYQARPETPQPLSDNDQRGSAGKSAEKRATGVALAEPAPVRVLVALDVPDSDEHEARAGLRLAAVLGAEVVE
jgi:hypothetical protein